MASLFSICSILFSLATSVGGDSSSVSNAFAALFDGSFLLAYISIGTSTAIEASEVTAGAIAPDAMASLLGIGSVSISAILK
jgi:hypothetical protein